MGIVSGIVVFVILWWGVFFAVLPWGVRAGGDPAKGQEPGAPANPRLWTKAAVTTAITAVLWLVVQAVIEADLIRFGSTPLGE